MHWQVQGVLWSMTQLSPDLKLPLIYVLTHVLNAGASPGLDESCASSHVPGVCPQRCTITNPGFQTAQAAATPLPPGSNPSTKHNWRSAAQLPVQPNHFISIRARRQFTPNMMQALESKVSPPLFRCQRANQLRALPFQLQFPPLEHRGQRTSYVAERETWLSAF
ncbi:hypothetical protein BJY00DRAFT_131621 [Aspergillus carlsbadensis]|nr:hypothetical protein BJY00DRAFT_131621 [Aspergillus carlsbadensis]